MQWLCTKLTEAKSASNSAMRVISSSAMRLDEDHDQSTDWKRAIA